MEYSHYGRMGTVHGTNDTTFGPAVWSHILDIDQHQVPVHGIADLLWGDEDVSG